MCLIVCIVTTYCVLIDVVVVVFRGGTPRSQTPHVVNIKPEPNHVVNISPTSGKKYLVAIASEVCCHNDHYCC